MAAMNHHSGRICRVVGPVVVADGLRGARIADVALVGAARLIGEIIRLDRDQVTLQVYEDTIGLRVGDPVISTGEPLMAELGPGLLAGIFDGLGRSLPDLHRQAGDFIPKGALVPTLRRDIRWKFSPAVKAGEEVEPGDVLGTVPETPGLAHQILVPPGVQGTVVEIRQGNFSVEEVVAWIATRTAGEPVEVRLMQRWPVRQARPCRDKLAPNTPLITGQRVIDTFFPIAKGGTAVIPGGFGTGKTVMEQTLAKRAEVQIVVYVGCGERGNEIAEVLAEFPCLIDPSAGVPLMDRTILIANTSNMPVAAREASIYTGLTIAEYYRDMGFDVALMADSTSRWGEALREVSGRLEEMPGEEGYPAYLGSRLADFYERAGRVVCLGRDRRQGSVTIIGAVSPPGGDFSEPMTQSSLRAAGAFWALDVGLARRRHFPAIHWITSYSLYDLGKWFEAEVAPDWNTQARQAMALLQKEEELLEIVQLVGSEALPDAEKAVLQVGRLLREDYLQQSAFDPNDEFCGPRKQAWMLRAILAFYRGLCEALNTGASLSDAVKLPVVNEIARMKELPREIAEREIAALVERVRNSFESLKNQSGRER
ncbi:MAG TPA: V-type ATP synthase subunit A [Candidatus Acidoferrales bacterium]|nr:V-type ATP synthase subunit A [Candidatus Acidoferrales bacterium]